MSKHLTPTAMPIESQTAISSPSLMSAPTAEYPSSSISQPSLPSTIPRAAVSSSIFSSSSPSISSRPSSSSAAAASTSSTSSATVASAAAAAVAAIPQVARDVCRLPLVLLSRLRLLLRRIRRRRFRLYGRTRATRGVRKESNGNIHYNGHVIGNNRDWYYNGENLGSSDGVWWWWWCMWILRSPGILFSKVLGDSGGNSDSDGGNSSPSMYKSKQHNRPQYRRRRRMSMSALIILSILSIICFVLLALTAVYKQPYWLICVLQYYHPDILWHIPLPVAVTDSSHDSDNNFDNKIVALTIDDVPSKYSLEIADILRENDAHATFFVIGSQAQLRGGHQVLTRLVEQGHELGNHGMRDEAAVVLEDETLVEQVQKVDEMLLKAYAEAKVEPKIKPEGETRDSGVRQRKRDVGAEVEPMAAAAAAAAATAASRVVSAPAPVPATPEILSPSLSKRKAEALALAKAKAKADSANQQPNDHPIHRLPNRHASPKKKKSSSSSSGKQAPQIPRLFRPGSALFNSRMRRTLARLDYTLVLGSIYPFDAQISDKERNSKHILDRVRPGAIIVCHDRRSWTPLMLRILLPELRRRGWRVGSVGEVLELQQRMEMEMEMEMEI